MTAITSNSHSNSEATSVETGNSSQSVGVSEQKRALEAEADTSAAIINLVTFVGDSSRGILFPVLWPLCQSLGGSEVEYGFIVAMYSMGRVCIVRRLGIISDQYHHRLTLILAGTIFVIGALIWANTQFIGPLAVLFIAQFVLGLGTGSLGVLRSYVAEQVAPAKRTYMLARLSALQYAGFAATPLFGSALVIAGSSISKTMEFVFPGYLVVILSMVCLGLLIFKFKDFQDYYEHPPEKQVDEKNSIELMKVMDTSSNPMRDSDKHSSTTSTSTSTSTSTNTAVSSTICVNDKANSTVTATSTPSEESGDAILVFLSGIQSIEKVSKALRQRGILQSLKAQVHILHGSQPSEVQRKVFKKTLPGEWKIVLATNIAETSITVSDVTHVVDAGYVKELRFDPANGGNSSLQEVFISRAAAQQRAGRAGRVRAGDCWRVYSQDYFESTRVDAFPLPEIQRVPLEEVVLQVLLLNLGTPEAFLSQCLQPPSLEQVRQAIATLLEVRAVLPIPNIPLTALGYHLARMPVDVRIGKMLIYASLLQCLEPVLTIAAALGGKSPFLTPLDSQRVEAQLSHSRYLYTHSVDSYAYSGCKGSTAGDMMTSLSLHKTPLRQPSAASTAQNTTACNGAPNSSSANHDSVSVTTNTMHTRTNHFSDHIAIVNCYNQFIHIVITMGSDAAYRYCKERYLNFNVLNEMRALREHFRAYLRQTGFVDNGSRSNKKSGNSINGVDGEDREFDEVEQMETEMNELNLSDASNSATEEINFALVKCVLCAGLYPNIVRLGRFKETTNNAKTTSNIRHSFAAAKIVQKIVQSDLSEVSLHPSSLLQSHTSNILDFMENKNNLNASTTSTGQDSANPASTDSGKSHYGLKGDTIGTKDAFLVYYKKMTINKQFLFDATVVPHASVLLFSNSELVFTHKTSRVCVSGWIEIHITELHCILFRRLQREIEDLLRVKVEDPTVDISTRQKNLTYIVSMLVN